MEFSLYSNSNDNGCGPKVITLHEISPKALWGEKTWKGNFCLLTPITQVILTTKLEQCY